MKNFFRLGLTVAIILGLSFSAALARGPRGGHGGGNLGGGRLGGLNQLGDSARDNVAPRAATKNFGQKANDLKNKTSQLNANNAVHHQPFSPAWYANHPNAWQFAHPHADAWAVATFGAATAWLGVTAGSGDASGDSTVTTADTSDDSTDESEESTSDPAAAAQLAQSGAVPTGAEFLPLGVFALAPKSQKEATAMVQIALSKSGAIRGSYFDVVSDEGHTIQGAVDKKTQRVAFTVANGKTIFETQLTDLTQPKGEISLHSADGTAADWTLARYDNAPFKGSVNK